MDIASVKIESSGKVPFKIYDSDYFWKALENFDYENSRARL